LIFPAALAAVVEVIDPATPSAITTTVARNLPLSFLLDTCYFLSIGSVSS
jgi:hypothetical protein